MWKTSITKFVLTVQSAIYYHKQHNGMTNIKVIHAVGTLQQMNSEVTEHFPHSPDLATSDYQVFGQLKADFKMMPLYKWSTSERHGARMICKPTNFLRHLETCGPLDYVNKIGLLYRHT
jgi:hypothetical protein